MNNKKTLYAKLDCNQCPDKYKLPCIKQYGKEREDGDDHRAVIGTHFCRYSWDDFFQIPK